MLLSLSFFSSLYLVLSAYSIKLWSNFDDSKKRVLFQYILLTLITVLCIAIQTMLACICILLGPPGRAQVFPYLSPGPLDLWWYAK
jgi:hypothetical protein